MEGEEKKEEEKLRVKSSESIKAKYFNTESFLLPSPDLLPERRKRFKK